MELKHNGDFLDFGYIILLSAYGDSKFACVNEENEEENYYYINYYYIIIIYYYHYMIMIFLERNLYIYFSVQISAILLQIRKEFKWEDSCELRRILDPSSVLTEENFSYLNKQMSKQKMNKNTLTNQHLQKETTDKISQAIKDFSIILIHKLRTFTYHFREKSFQHQLSLSWF